MGALTSKTRGRECLTLNTSTRLECQNPVASSRLPSSIRSRPDLLAALTLLVTRSCPRSAANVRHAKCAWPILVPGASWHGLIGPTIFPCPRPTPSRTRVSRHQSLVRKVCRSTKFAEEGPHLGISIYVLVLSLSFPFLLQTVLQQLSHPLLSSQSFFHPVVQEKSSPC
jgi:hypothetical protein